MPRVNEKIRVKEVRLIDSTGKQLGIKATTEALQLARETSMDLVEISPSAAPPVCKIMDFGKYKYELNKKSKENKKRQKTVVTKEVKMRPKIDDHDFDTKLKHAQEFLKEGCKVKVYVMFKGREIAYKDFGYKLIERLAAGLVELGTPEKRASEEGRNLIAIFTPKVQPVEAVKKSETKAEQTETKTEPKAETKIAETAEPQITPEAETAVTPDQK